MEEAGDCDGKFGKELFLELYRLLPSSQAEDYYQFGQWKDDDIRLDFDLLQAHRREAGAEDPPALEELEAEHGPPELPDNRAAGYARSYGAQGNVGPASTPAFGSAGVARALPKPAAVTTTLRPQQPKSAPTSAMVAAAAGGVGGPSAELRQIALFIAKFKLEATKTKLLLARLTPPRRRFVMTKFTQGTTGAPTAQLEQYIGQCERSNSWGETAAAGVGAPAPVSGIKRPLTATAISVDPNKRARVGVGPTAYAAAPRSTMYGQAPPRPMQYGQTQYARTSPAWLAGPSAAVSRWPAAPMPARATYGGGVAAAKPGGYGPAPQRYGGGMPAHRPATPKYAGAIKPTVPRPGAPKAGAKAKPGSLIANLLSM